MRKISPPPVFEKIGLRRSFPLAGSGGLTLLEILIALTIMGLIAGVLWGVLRMGARSWERGENKTTEMQRIRVVTEQLSQDLGSMFFPSQAPDGTFEGLPEAVLFLTSTSGLDPAGSRWGVRKVAYKLDSDGNLVLEERFPFEEEFSPLPAQTLVLAKGVARLRFRYYDSQSDPPEWKETWSLEEEDRLPGAVEVTLALLDPEDEDGPELSLPPLVVPIRARQPMRRPGLLRTPAREDAGKTRQ